MQIQQVNAQVEVRMDKMEGMFIKFMNKSKTSEKRAKERKAHKIKRGNKVTNTLEHEKGKHEKVGTGDQNLLDNFSSSSNSSDSEKSSDSSDSYFIFNHFFYCFSIKLYVLFIYCYGNIYYND